MSLINPQFRNSWKTLLAQYAPQLDAGETIQLTLENPNAVIGLRNAAKVVGVNLVKRGNSVMLSKGAATADAILGQMNIGKFVRLRVQPEWTPSWEWEDTIEGQAKKFAAHAYGHYVRYNKSGQGFRTINEITDKTDLVRTQMGWTTWWVLQTQDLTLDQPTQPTLDKVLREIYERDAFDQPSSLLAIANACARLNVALPWEMFNDTSVEIPLMTNEETYANVERMWLASKRHSAPFIEAKLDKRREDEAEKIYDIND